MRLDLALVVASALGGIVSAQCEVARFQKAEASEVSTLAPGVALEGDTVAMAVGSGPNLLVRVFELQGGVWLPTASVQAGTMNEFSPLSLSDSALVVGDPSDGDLGADAGAVFTFERVGDDWVQGPKLYAPDGEAGDFFGKSVALSGATLVIGTNGNDDAGTNAGAAHVFEYTAGAWLHIAKLIGSDTSVGDGFGYAVAIDGDTLVVDARQDDDGAAEGGTAFVFERQAGSWVETAKLVPSLSQDFTPYENVDIEADTIVLGNSILFSSVGTAAVFMRVGGGWVEQQQLFASDLATADEFGKRVAVANGRILVGAKGKEPPVTGPNLGTIYVFEGGAEGGPWIQTDKLDGDAVGFGTTLWVDGDRYATRVTEGVDLTAVRFYSFEESECPSFFAKQMFASVTAGGQQTMVLSTETGFALKLYFVLGSLSGTAPGLPIQGEVLPLIPDPYFFLTANHPNTPPLGASLGFVDSQGAATTTFTVPPGTTTALIGATFFHAALVIDASTGIVLHASNPIVEVLTP